MLEMWTDKSNLSKKVCVWDVFILLVAPSAEKYWRSSWS